MTHCAIEAELLLRIMSEVNRGRRGSIWARRTVLLRMRDRTKGRNIGSNGEVKSQVREEREMLVIDKLDTCEVGLKMCDEIRFSFLSFLNRSVKGIISILESYERA
jgi:hypothetical protein